MNFFFLMWLCTMKRKEKNKEIFEKNDWVNKNYYFFWNENLFLIFDNTYLISFVLFCFPFWERERERGVFFFFQCHFIKRDNTYLSIYLSCYCYCLEWFFFVKNIFCFFVVIGQSIFLLLFIKSVVRRYLYPFSKHKTVISLNNEGGI